MSNRYQEENMSKTTTAAALAAIIAMATTGAYAQTQTVPETRVVPETRAALTTHVIQSDEIRASKMIGSTVYDVHNRDIGNVKDLVLNKKGMVDAVVLDVGSFLGVGGKYVAVPISDIKTDNNRLTLDRTKEQLQQMTKYELENPNTGAGTSTSPPTGGSLGR
jgi:sporulation protein YlmC with PRC-barrel domain